jgi:hypothetical protein
MAEVDEVAVAIHEEIGNFMGREKPLMDTDWH